MRYRGLFRLFAFLVLLTGLAVGSLAAARAEVSPLASGQESVAPSLAYEADSALRFPGTPVQRCSGAIDATGTAGAGIGRLIGMGHGYYNFVLQLNSDFLAQFSPALTSFGYAVTYAVNGQVAKGLFAGDIKFRPAGDHIHSGQRIQERRYTHAGSKKKFTINTGDILELKIVDYLVIVEPQGSTFVVHGNAHVPGVTCPTSGTSPWVKSQRTSKTGSRKLDGWLLRTSERRSRVHLSRWLSMTQAIPSSSCPGLAA